MDTHANKEDEHTCTKEKCDNNLKQVCVHRYSDYTLCGECEEEIDVQTFATNKRRGQEHMIHMHVSYHTPKRKRSMCMLWCVNSAKSRMVKELYGYTDASGEGNS